MANWRTLAARLDKIVDDQYGEAARIVPYKPGGYMSPAVADTTRTAASVVGLVIGRGTFLRAAGNASFIAKRAEADLLLSIQDKYWTGFKEGDRVVLSERNDMTCEISYVEHGSNGRMVLHLLKKDVEI